MVSFKSREFGSLLDWKPLVVDGNNNRILVNLNPESINESGNTQNQENTIIDSIFGGR